MSTVALQPTTQRAKEHRRVYNVGYHSQDKEKIKEMWTEEEDVKTKPQLT